MSTPAYRVATSRADLLRLAFPVVVKPRHESSSYGLALAADETQAAEAIARIVRRYGQPALVAEYVEDRAVCVALLDLRIDEHGVAHALEINSMASLGRTGAHGLHIWSRSITGR